MIDGNLYNKGYQAGLKAALRNLPPEIPRSSVMNVPVSLHCNFRLTATGPYTRESVERFIKQVQLGLELGAFDEGSESIISGVPLNPNQECSCGIPSERTEHLPECLAHNGGAK